MKKYTITKVRCVDAYTFDPDTGAEETTAVFLMDEKDGHEYFINLPCNTLACPVLFMIDACQHNQPVPGPFTRTVKRPMGDTEKAIYSIVKGKFKIEIYRSGSYRNEEWVGEFPCNSKMIEDLQIELRSNRICSCGP
ncbi:MAG: hypothetical protein PVH88_20365 [Ignavibacteria bacterium]|jgi:hypothetical protein